MKRHLAAALIGCCVSTAHAQSNDTAALGRYCDAYARAALRFYEARLSGITHLAELQEVPAVIQSLNPLGETNPEGAIDVTLMVLQHAYTFSFPSAQAFADFELKTCLK